MKAGYKTTEFYVTVSTAVIGLALAFGLISPEQSAELQSSALLIIGAASELIGGLITAIAVLGYNISRGLAKGKSDDRS